MLRQHKKEAEIFSAKHASDRHGQSEEGKRTSSADIMLKNWHPPCLRNDLEQLSPSPVVGLK